MKAEAESREPFLGEVAWRRRG